MFDGHFEQEGNRGCLTASVFVVIVGLLTAWSGLTKPDWFEVGGGLLVAFVALILSWRISHDVVEEKPLQSALVRLLAFGIQIWGIKTKENRDQ